MSHWLAGKAGLASLMLSVRAWRYRAEVGAGGPGGLAVLEEPDQVLSSTNRTDEAVNLDGGHYEANLAAEVLALRDSVQGWQLAGRPGGLPVDIEADRRLSDAVTHLTSAAAALDALTAIENSSVGGTHISVDTSGRTRVQAGSTVADRERLVRDARRVAETIRPRDRGSLVYDTVRPFGDAVKFRGVSTPGEYSALAPVGDAALAYRSHCWKHDPRS